MNTLLRISVVIPTFNRLDTLRYVIPALLGPGSAPPSTSRSSLPTRTRTTVPPSTSPVCRVRTPTSGICRDRIPAGLPRATPGSAPPLRRSCCLPTPTSSLHPICSAAISRATRCPAARARSSGSKCRSIRTPTTCEERASVGARRAASAFAQDPRLALLFNRQRFGAARAARSGRTLRRRFHRLRARGSRTRLPAQACRRRDSSTSRARSTITGIPSRSISSKGGWNSRASRRCASIANTRPWACRPSSGMTPLSLALHDVVDRAPAIRSAGSKRTPRRPGFARTLSFQYHYLTGVKAALRGPSEYARVSCGALRARTTPAHGFVCAVGSTAGAITAA